MKCLHCAQNVHVLGICFHNVDSLKLPVEVSEGTLF